MNIAEQTMIELISKIEYHNSMADKHKALDERAKKGESPEYIQHRDIAKELHDKVIKLVNKYGL